MATIIWVFGVWLHRKQRFSRDFGRLSGTYRVMRKLADQPEQETVSIGVQRNLLAVEFGDLEDGESVTGEIVMNEQLHGSGEGYYRHVKDGVQMWGFWDIQVKDATTILVHTTYANPKTYAAVVSGFVWSRIPR
ncbi:MAG: hypothetical protein ACJ757_02720 [Gaiellaceae bacterium]